MSYQIPSDCERVALYVLAGADSSLVGLEFHNCRVLSMPYIELLNIAIQLYGREALHYVTTSIYNGQYIPNNSDLVVLEVADYSGGQIDFYDRYLFTLLKLYKAEDVYPCYSLMYHCNDGALSSQGFVHRIEYKHAVVFRENRYIVNELERILLPSWLDKCILALFTNKINDQFSNMLQAYDTSYLIGIAELEYVMLFSVLEMAFGSGHSEITYQISRGTALLLANDASSMEDIFKRMKKLYNERSKYVHEGKKIKIEALYELRNFVRQVLLKLIDLEYHKDGKSFKDLQNQILLGGFATFAKTGE